MALNFSHRPIFSSHLTEENLVSSLRIPSGCHVDGRSENVGDSLCRSWHSNGEIEGFFDFGCDKGDLYGSQDSVSNDILDLLPSDPFGMDISTTFTAITGWLEDLEVDYGRYNGEEVGKGDGSYQLFADLNFIWNNAMRFQAFPSSTGFKHKSHGFGSCSRDKDARDEPYHNRFVPDSLYSGNCITAGFDSCSTEKAAKDASSRCFGPASNMEDFGFSFCPKEKVVPDASCNDSSTRAHNGEDILDLHNLNLGSCNHQSEGSLDKYSHSYGDAHHVALNYAIGYLGLRDLLVVGMVSKSLRHTVQTDPIYWTSIHIGQPLNEKVNDDVLLQLTNKAEGNLQCLSVVDCPWITDIGLKRVLETNPKLTKLNVPGCTRLTIGGIMNSLKSFKSTSAQGVKHLRIGGIYGVTVEHFEDLKSLLGIENLTTQKKYKPHFYLRGSFYLSCEDDRSIDIEMCPRCENLKIVYDCPLKDCQGKEHATQVCRGCIICIPRCVQCGRCICDNEYEETFSLECICYDCEKQRED